MIPYNFYPLFTPLILHKTGYNTKRVVILEQYDEFIQLLQDWEDKYFQSQNPNKFVELNPMELPENLSNIN